LAVRRGHAFLRFDFYGHGQSSGDFKDGTISRWRDDALFVLDRLGERPQILVGSSMGAWIALLVARHRPEKVAGLLLLAPAVDFTERLIWARMSPKIRRELMEKGEWMRPSAYHDGPYPITRTLIEDGRKNLVLDAPIAIDCPVHILHGMQDEDVPWQDAVQLIEHLHGNATLMLVKDGNHRLSRPADLKRIEHALNRLVAELGARA
jgi:pimeloyl-ACP methyl ester carboxylesterase